MIKPSNFFLESCIKVTISPSMLDCVNSKLIPISFALFPQFILKSSKVVDPYCDCSLSPNRLRFGPLIIIILLFIQLLYIMKKIKKIKIQVNSKITQIKDESNLQELVNKLKIPIKKIAIELNQEIVDKNKLKKYKLKEKDKIEIVDFIGGG